MVDWNESINDGLEALVMNTNGPEGIANQPASPIAKDEKNNVDNTLPRSCSMKGDCARHGRCVLGAGDSASAKIAAWARTASENDTFWGVFLVKN